MLQKDVYTLSDPSDRCARRLCLRFERALVCAAKGKCAKFPTVVCHPLSDTLLLSRVNRAFYLTSACFLFLYRCAAADGSRVQEGPGEVRAHHGHQAVVRAEVWIVCPGCVSPAFRERALYVRAHVPCRNVLLIIYLLVSYVGGAVPVYNCIDSETYHLLGLFGSIRLAQPICCCFVKVFRV